MSTLKTIEASSEPEPLRRFKVAFCDSLEALREARALGLPVDARILTNAPPLVLSGDSAIETLRTRASADSWQRYWGNHRDFQLQLQQTIVSGCAADLSTALAPIALRGFLWVHRALYSASCIQEADLSEPRLVIEPAFTQRSLFERFGSFWGELLSQNSDLLVWRYPVQFTTERALSGGDPPDVVSRLQVGSWRKLVYRAALAIGGHLPSGYGRGTIAIIGENELLRDSAAALFLRGFKITRLKLPRVSEGKATIGLPASLLAELEALISRRWATLIPDALAKALGHLWIDRVAADWATYSTLLPQVLGLLPAGTRAVITNYPKGAEAIAVATALERNGIPFVSFQHGVAREISASHELMETNLETTVSGRFVGYNQRATAISSEQKFAKMPRRAITAGLSTDHRSVSRARSSQTADPALFVSTALYRGYRQLRFDTMTDTDVACDELALVDCLDRLPHRVAYKPYPALRYVDSDPVIERVRRAGNLTLVGTNLDLRYIIGSYRLIITSRATSTIAWCLLSSKPVIYIDTIDSYRMRPAAQAALRAGGLVIDQQDTDWMTQLIAMTSQPLDVIEQLWHQRKSERIRFIETYLDSGNANPAAVAARWISDEIAGADTAEV